MSLEKMIIGYLEDMKNTMTKIEKSQMELQGKIVGLEQRIDRMDQVDKLAKRQSKLF